MKTRKPVRPRILHVLSSFDTGGMEQVVASVIGGSRHRYDHGILCMNRAGAATRLLPPETPVEELHKPPGNPPMFLVRLAKHMRRWRPHLVCTYNWAGMDAVLAARLGRVGPVLQNEHGWVMDDLEGRNRKRLLVRRLLSSSMDAVVCVSKQMESWLSRIVRVRCPVVQIYNGIDTDLYHPGDGTGTLRRELGIPDEAFLLGIVARLDPIKNHGCLLEAMALVRQRHPEAYLAVIGDGPLRDRLRAQAGDGVFFLGERKDVPKILPDVDLFVLPSFKEGISMTLLEAMACGVPVIARRVGGNPEVVEDGVTGTLLDHEGPEELAHVVEDYILHPEKRRQQGARARERVLSRFDRRMMCHSYEVLYQSLLQGKGFHGIH